MVVGGASVEPCVGLGVRFTAGVVVVVAVLPAGTAVLIAFLVVDIARHPSAGGTRDPPGRDFFGRLRAVDM